MAKSWYAIFTTVKGIQSKRQFCFRLNRSLQMPILIEYLRQKKDWNEAEHSLSLIHSDGGKA